MHVIISKWRFISLRHR